MNLTVIFVIIAVIAFIVIVWNLLLPLPSSQNKQFVGFLSDIFRRNYENNSAIQKYIENPIVTPIREQVGNLVNDSSLKPAKYTLGPVIQSSPKLNNVTLTFYVEYGSNQYLQALLDLLYQYHISKAVFFLDKTFAKENYFVVQRIQYDGYQIHDWQTIGQFDKDYPPTVFDGVTLSAEEILNQTKSDKNAVSFLDVAIHYYDSSIVAFTPKIMNHPALLESLLQHNGKDILFVDNSVKVGENVFSFTSSNATGANIGDTDPILQYLTMTNVKGIQVNSGDWTLTSLSHQYPNAVRFIPQKNAFLISKQMSIGHDAVVDFSNQNVLLQSSHDPYNPPAILEVLGDVKTMNTTITSYDIAVNGPNPDGFNPRSFIIVRDGGKMDLYNSSLMYLGFSKGGFQDTRFSRAAIGYYNTSNVMISNSILAHNYYGFYSAYSKNISIVGSQVHDNTRYGLDPHTYTSNLFVSGNHIYNNGNQGFICSQFCLNVTVTNNLVEHNVEGIGIHWLTNSSVVKDNIVRYNQKYGIFIQKMSFNNLVANNTVIGNLHGIGLLQGSNLNNVTGNVLVDNVIDQIKIDPDSQSNLFSNNLVYSSENTNSIPDRIKPLMSEDINGTQK
jgi:parallel beta-helix repeat protein